MDVTWDDPNESADAVSGYENHMYFGLPGEVFYEDHLPQEDPVFVCNSYDCNYFIHTGKVSMWTELFRDDISASLNAEHFHTVLEGPDYYPTEKTGALTDQRKHIAYNVAAYGLSELNWEAFGAPLNMAIAYDCGKYEMVADIDFGDELLILPEALTTIDEEAFDGDSTLTYVALGHNVKTIGSNAFRNCTGLWDIYVPASVTSIDDSAFSNCPHLTITGQSGSYAQTFAEAHGIYFPDQ